MKKTWALKLVGRHTLNDKKLGPVINFPRTVKLLQAEHARAVRVVKARDKWLLDGGYDNMSPDFRAGYHQACQHILTALQKWRA